MTYLPQFIHWSIATLWTGQTRQSAGLVLTAVTLFFPKGARKAAIEARAAIGKHET
jgi:hypothetical protein